MPRPRTKGSVEWVGNDEAGHWRARITVAPRTREWVDLPPTITRAQEPKARARAVEMERLALVATRKAPRETSRTAAAKAAPAAPAETFTLWSERWFASRAARGLKSISSDESRFTTWVLARLGEMAPAAITREHVEGWVEWIDAEVQAGHLSWKTAQNAWGLLSRAMTEAAAGKVKALRCRRDNPCLGVEPPERGTRKSKVYLYPSEFLALVSCELLPLAQRRAYAVTVYLYPRAGEVEALEWESLDLEHAVAHVHQAVDPDTRKVTSTKGRASRRFEVEPELVPLLVAMRAERPKDRLVFDPWPLHRDRAGQLRDALRTAGVTRAELYADDATRKAITFHDLRATGTTWAAIRGDDPLKIMHRAGHRDLATTTLYVREAENVRRGFGQVFPPLPAALGLSQGLSHGTNDRREVPDQKAVARFGERDSNPGADLPPRARPAERHPARPTEVPVEGGARTPSADHGTNGGTNTCSRRDVLEGDLQRAVAELSAAGDLDAAQVALDALRRLRQLGAELEAPVVDLTAVRAARGR